MSGSDTGAPLNLVYLAASQSQPEVLINEAWDKINDFAATGSGSDTHTDTGRSITVSDGTTTVHDVTEIDFTHAGSVTDEGGGIVRVNNTPGGGGSGGGSAILPIAFGDANIVTPDNTGFTLDLDSNTGTASIGPDGELIIDIPSAIVGNICYRKAYANIDFDVRFYLTTAAISTQGGWGVLVRDSSTGNALTFGASGAANNAAPTVLALTSTPGSSIGGFAFSSSPGSYATSAVPPVAFQSALGWVRLTRVGNNYSFYISIDGEAWVPLGAAVSSTFAAAPNQFGLFFFGMGKYKFWSMDGF